MDQQQMLLKMAEVETAAAFTELVIEIRESNMDQIYKQIARKENKPLLWVHMAPDLKKIMGSDL